MQPSGSTVAIVGTGFVADLYMRSLQAFPELRVAAAYDRDPSRLEAFCRHWSVPPAASLDALLAHASAGGSPALVLNLTNPGSHHEVTKHCLEKGRHVYSEKPLAMRMDHAGELHRLARDRKLFLASAPCNHLSQTAQTLHWAVREGLIGRPLLAYAELDDDFITQAPYRKWISESGAPWPYRDEFEVGCTVEHAGYYLTWLMMIFGPVRTVVAASARVVHPKVEGETIETPDFSTAALFFDRGMVARLTCSIVAPHGHGLRLFGERGVLEVDECWNNHAPVRLRRRHVIRRRLINNPFARTVHAPGVGQPRVRRRGAASMNFALGPAAVLAAIARGEPPEPFADLALHLNEVTLAIQNAGAGAGAQAMRTRFDDPTHAGEPVPAVTPGRS
ncbi:MAG TPA: Gfo/Idh/MocA family oxidoreductase [Caldimonas sp.]|jgi:predicted dehydrogenase|nr:Gfo/Idh/MocA family oxidoreductase [Caldimonas sp.]HEX2541932.1 Gfo/Idh/MocA family oxidoreductase [Caldimonas sp.]